MAHDRLAFPASYIKIRKRALSKIPFIFHFYIETLATRSLQMEGFRQYPSGNFWSHYGDVVKAEERRFKLLGLLPQIQTKSDISHFFFSIIFFTNFFF